ncbi:isopentenyl-diphosphate Delta-isomerase [Clostridium beijerinckii]|uniref:isopentenyl-diphosphate Delta-isomerase n=1 Tax=Clostridium beijerinckii TaxID=1520 RepID=UPI00047A4504|nr:isopentenyl-diphosphate Delta-isomerase [Clostridium beijerinckii]
MAEYIIAVNESDNEIGSIEKMEAHRKGTLHRAFSILVFNSKNQLLLQKRNVKKYHSPGLWTNTCCSHPKYGESLNDAIHRRLREEMGFTCELEEVFSFIYKVKLENDLFENEYDHVFIGKYDGEVIVNKDEVDDFKWGDINEIKKDIVEKPELYTYWFKYLVNKAEDKIFK